MAIEIFDVVDADDTVIGHASRSEVHGNPSLIHRVAHILVFNQKGDLYLQRRSFDKDVQPGKWDTSVGGHVDSGEEYGPAAERELREELGIADASLKFLWKYLHRNDFESEYVCTYKLVFDGSIEVDPTEIIDGKFWPIPVIEGNLGSGIFTPNFEDEFNRYIAYESESGD